jgi:hypothetical protein
MGLLQALTQSPIVLSHECEAHDLSPHLRLNAPVDAETLHYAVVFAILHGAVATLNLDVDCANLPFLAEGALAVIFDHRH